tara:strand:- start:36 stop:404 length:369 start_codon:yes stop_codon:yes gene_type:complete
MVLTTNFINAIKKWLLLDDYINESNTKIKRVKEDKNTIEISLLKYIKSNNLENTNFEIDFNTIHYSKNNINANLSLRLLVEVLDETIEDTNLKNRILNNINLKKQTKSKENEFLKRKLVKKD